MLVDGISGLVWLCYLFPLVLVLFLAYPKIIFFNFNGCYLG
jgi:hypothetical protein